MEENTKRVLPILSKPLTVDCPSHSLGISRRGVSSTRGMDYQLWTNLVLLRPKEVPSLSKGNQRESRVKSRDVLVFLWTIVYGLWTIDYLLTPYPHCAGGGGPGGHQILASLSVIFSKRGFPTRLNSRSNTTL